MASSRRVRQSHKTLPLGVLTRIARWPMANLGVVMREWKFGFESIWVQVLEYLFASWEREVQVWPWAGTYWRGSCLGVKKVGLVLVVIWILNFWYKNWIDLGRLGSTYIANHAPLQRRIGGLIEFCSAGDAYQVILLGWGGFAFACHSFE